MVVSFHEYEVTRTSYTNQLNWKFFLSKKDISYVIFIRLKTESTYAPISASLCYSNHSGCSCQKFLTFLPYLVHIYTIVTKYCKNSLAVLTTFGHVLSWIVLEEFGYADVTNILSQNLRSSSFKYAEVWWTTGKI